MFFGLSRRPVRLAALLRALLIGLPLVLAACESAEERLAGHLERAEELFEAGDIEKAMLEYRNALQIDNDSVEANLGMARGHESTQDFPPMISRLNRVIELDPNNVEALTKLGQVMLMAGQLDRALSNASAAVDAAPNDADALAVKASVSLRLGNTDQAVDLAREALAIRPSMPLAGAVLIGERVAADDPEAALALADQFIADNPDTLSIALVKLQILDTLGDVPVVETYLRELITTFPEQPQLRRSLIQLYLRENDTEAAEAEIRALSESFPENSDAALDLVRFVIRTDGIDAGRAELERLIAGREDPFPYQIALVQIEQTNGAPEAAEARLRGLIDDGDLASERVNQARLLLARYRQAAGDLAGTETLIADVLEADAENVGALGLRAALAYEAGDFDAAILDVRQALGLAPDNVGLLRLSARANQRNGSTDLAGERYGAAVEASGYEPEVVLEYVRFLQGTGRSSAILQMLELASERHGNNRDLLIALASAQLRAGDWMGADQTAARIAAIDADGGDTASQRIRAASLSGREQYSESIEILRGLAENPDEQGNAMAALIEVYLRAGQQDEAAAFLDNVLAENPGNFQALLLRAALHVATDNPEQAEETFRLALAAAPTAPSGHLSYARFLVREDRREDAKAALIAGIETVDTPSALRLMLGGLYETDRDYDAAIAEYEALYAEQPNSPLAANNLASLLAEHRAGDPAVLPRALEIAAPLERIEVPALQDTYGWLLHLNGDSERALRWLLPAVEGLPDNPYVRYHIGLAYKTLGDNAEARRHLEAALAADPAVPFSARTAAETALAELPAPAP